MSGSTFQSTPSGGKATVAKQAVSLVILGFNPRLPGGRRRGRAPVAPPANKCFNPRLPGGRRPLTASATPLRVEFQSTPSGGKATW